MAKVKGSWKSADTEVRTHYEVFQQAMQETGIRWEEPPQQNFKLQMLPQAQTPDRVPTERLMPAPVGKRRSIPEPGATEPCSAQEQVATPVVKQLAAAQPEELSVPQEEKSGEAVSDEAVESQLPEVFRLQTREDVMWQLQRLGPGPAQDTVLEILEAANAALRQATHLDQAKQLSDVAEVLAVCAQKLAMAQTVQNEAIAFAIRAEHRYNEIIQVARKRGEIADSARGQLRGRKTTGERNIAQPCSASGVPESPLEKTFEGPERNPEKTPVPTLAQIGIDKPKAKRLHRWTGISSQELERRIEEKRAEGKLSKAAVLSDSEAPKKEPKPYQPFLSFLKDLEKHPQNYDGESLVNDPEVTILYGQVRARLLGLIESLEPNE
jgi:hypothetical protein